MSSLTFAFLRRFTVVWALWLEFSILFLCYVLDGLRFPAILLQFKPFILNERIGLSHISIKNESPTWGWSLFRGWPTTHPLRRWQTTLTTPWEWLTTLIGVKGWSAHPNHPLRVVDRPFGEGVVGHSIGGSPPTPTTPLGCDHLKGSPATP